MEKNILVIIDDIPTFNISVNKDTTINDLKKSLRKYSDVTIHFFLNENTESKVFDSNKYDKVKLSSVWSQVDTPYIKISSKILNKPNKYGFSGIKDVDREILLAMADEDLLKTCSLNKYFLQNVCDDNFFYKRLLGKYPDALKYYNKETDKNYKSYYLKVIYYISKMKEDYDYSFVSGNPKIQYEIFKIAGKYIDDLLFESSIKGELNLVKEAIKRGADIHTFDENALRYASANGHLDIVKYLVEHGANIHVNNEYALRLASSNGYLEIVKYLVEKGADIHAVHEAALRFASANGHLEVVKYLISIGANIHINNDEALQNAIESGHLQVVKYLQQLQ